MLKAPRKEISPAPFPFVRQFTSPPFFVGLEDAKLQSQLLLDAVQHAGVNAKKAPAKRKAVKKRTRKVASAKKRSAKKKRSA